MTSLFSPAHNANDHEPTATQSGHFQTLGGFNTISDALDYAAQGATGLNFYSSRGALTASLSYHQLRMCALAVAGRLISAGLKPGDHVAIIAETNPDFPIVFYGCQYAGLVPCPVPFTSYIAGKDAYIARVTRMMDACGARALIGPDAVTTIFTENMVTSGRMVLSFSALATMPEAELTPVLASDIAYIQYSSGSTAHPKGIIISQKAVTTNAAAILRNGMRLTPQDRAFSWLPFYHDMGLVGFMIAPMFGQCTVDYLPAAAFVRRPSLWLQLMSQNRTTISYAPTFGYDLAAQRFRADEQTAIDLSHWRIAGVGGDMIRADVLERFSERLKPAKFNKQAFLPSYGLAEATLALTFAGNGEGVVMNCPERLTDNHTIDLEEKTRPQVKQFVSCGRPIPGHTILIVDSDGAELPDRHIGHIRVRGSSLMQGYLNEPTLTETVLKPDGFMETGDLGYMVNGSLTVTGRVKDLIIINGRNIWPEDIEWVTEEAAGLKHGDVVAFAVTDSAGQEEIIVLVHGRGMTTTEQDTVKTRITSAISQSTGTICNVVFVPPRTIPVTSSGKLQRNTAKSAYLKSNISRF